MSATAQESANAAQIDYWNATAGTTWANFQTLLDRQLEPLGLRAMEVLAPATGERIVDIGCGCGQTSAALAERVGASGAVTGVDVSLPMLEVAQARPIANGAARAQFRQTDAQTGDLGEARFDAAFSRFGVMFFSDPAVAFANIRRALKPGARLAFVCWRPFQENPWMRAPFEAAAALLPPMPPVDPLAPGPFAFSDPARVTDILTRAGFHSVTIQPFDASIGGSGIEDTLRLTFKVGPLGAALRENPQCAEAVESVVKQVIEGFATPAGVFMPAAVWIVSARVGA